MTYSLASLSKLLIDAVRHTRNHLQLLFCLMGQFRRSLIHFTLSAHQQVTQHIEDMNHEPSSYLLNGSNKETIHGPASSTATANGVYRMAMSILSTSLQKGFLFWQLYFFHQNCNF